MVLGRNRLLDDPHCPRRFEGVLTPFVPLVGGRDNDSMTFWQRFMLTYNMLFATAAGAIAGWVLLASTWAVIVGALVGLILGLAWWWRWRDRA